MEMNDVIEEVEPEVEPNPGEKEPAKKGCGGSIEASLVGISALALVAFGALFIDRKRKMAK